MAWLYRKTSNMVHSMVLHRGFLLQGMALSNLLKTSNRITADDTAEYSLLNPLHGASTDKNLNSHDIN